MSHVAWNNGDPCHRREGGYMSICIACYTEVPVVWVHPVAQTYIYAGAFMAQLDQEEQEVAEANRFTNVS